MRRNLQKVHVPVGTNWDETLAQLSFLPPAQVAARSAFETASAALCLSESEFGHDAVWVTIVSSSFLSVAQVVQNFEQQ